MRRHHQEGVVGQQLADRVNVPSLEGVREPTD
jgi:hypothetical protein